MAGTGNITYLGGDKYKFTVSNGFNPDGTRNRSCKTIIAKGKTDEAKQDYVKRQLALFENEVKKGEHTKPTHYTLSSYVDVWKVNAARDLAPKTFYRYNELLKLHILPTIGNCKLENINAIVLEDCYNTLREPRKRTITRKDGSTKEKEYTLSEQTLKHIHRLIGTILQTAFRKGLIKENPITRTDAPKVKRKEPRVYDEEQIAELIKALEDTDIQFKTAVHLTLASGCRLGELIGIEWPCVDYSKNTIEIKQAGQYLPGKGVFTKEPKNETSKRIISMPGPVMDLISDLEHAKKVQKMELANKWKGGYVGEKKENEEDKPGRLFTQVDGSPIFPDTLSKQWRKFIKEKELPDLTWHQIRHTSASYLIACGQDVVSVSKRLGHAKPSTTSDIYAHALKKRDQASAAYMDKLYTKKEKADNKAN